MRNYIDKIKQVNCTRNQAEVRAINSNSTLSSIQISKQNQHIQKKHTFENDIAEIAYQLMRFNPLDRISCKEAARELRTLQENLFTNLERVKLEHG